MTTEETQAELRESFQKDRLTRQEKMFKFLKFQ